MFIVLAGALLLMAAFAPGAKADLIAYFNFEDAADGDPPDFTSEADQGLGVATTITTNYLLGNMATVPGFGDINRVAGDVDNPPNGLHALGLTRTFLNNGAHFDIPLFTSQGFFSNMSVPSRLLATGTASRVYSFCSALMEEEVFPLLVPRR